MRNRNLVVGLLCISIFLNFLFIWEIYKYEPERYKYRHYNRLRQTGYLDEKVPLSVISKNESLVILTFGQSNAANSSSDSYQPKEEVYNYAQGKLFKAKEPLIGTGGPGTSVWTRLADKLIAEGRCKNVILIPIAEGGTSAAYWAKGNGNVKLRETMESLVKNDIKLTHILWHQGEADNGKSPRDYKTSLNVILKTIRSFDKTVPFYCSIASYNIHENYDNLGVDSLLQKAQREFVSENKNVYLGPNTDELIYAIHRIDGQHFSTYGNKMYANKWLEALNKN